MKMSYLTRLLSVVMAFTAVAHAQPLPYETKAANVGVVNCANSLCHGSASSWKDSNILQNEYITWSRVDKHATRAYQVLFDERSRRIARNLGLKEPAHETRLCLDCHTYNPAPAQRGERFKIADGISCEACHGPAEKWIQSHVAPRATHADNLADGLYPTNEPLAQARLCLSCHFGNKDKFVTHRMMGAGHPRLAFELDTFSQTQPPHFVIDADWQKRKGTWDPTRVWAVGQAFWQRRDGPYWGHNAIFRIAPFRAHCRLEPLPDGSPILSHDQVEAARLAAAGWGVTVWADDRGSYEANPPAMPEFLHRDDRWLAGNLQYWHLLRLPGFSAMGRWQLVQAMLLFAGAPLYVAMFVLAVVVAAQAPEASPRGPILAFAAAWAGALYAPKLLGYAETLLFPARRAAYGGGRAMLAGAGAEFVFTLLLDAPSYIGKLIAMARLALGATPGWLPQNRADRGVTWGEASRLYWPQTLFGVATFGPLGWFSPDMALLALPFAGGLLCVIPFCVATSSPWFSAWLRARRVAAMPEELVP